MCDDARRCLPHTGRGNGDMLRGPVTVLLVGLDDADMAALAREDGFDVRGAHTIEGRSGFAPIAEHHLRMADRAGEPVIFVFVRIEEHDALRTALGSEAADELARDAAGVVLNSVRESDVPGRIAPDTFCILLTGEAEGAETTVLSRLVEAMAVHDARRDPPRTLRLSVGTARYEPGSGLHLAELLETAIRRLDRSGA